MKPQRCKGTRDLLPNEMARFRRIEQVFRTCCSQWGYEEVRTPTLEYLHLFTATGTLTPAMLGRVYSFLDWDGWTGERVVLRPDGTIPTARLYVDSFPSRRVARFFYVENVFRFEATGKEARERWQCGAELIGSAKPEGDAELILLALEILRKLGLDPVEVQISHAGLIKASLEGLGLKGLMQTEVLERVFARDVEALSEMKREIPGLENSLDLLFGLQGSSPGFLENLKSVLCSSIPGIEPGIDNLGEIAHLLERMGCDYRINIAAGRAFEYYTGAIFQFYCSGRQVGGGGRYDELITLVGGESVPASGFALYVDELMDLLAPSALKPATSERVLIKTETSDVDAVRLAFEVASRLREANFVAELDPGYQETTAFRWVLSVDTELGASLLDLMDQTTGKKLRGASVAEILACLEEARCK